MIYPEDKVQVYFVIGIQPQVMREDVLEQECMHAPNVRSSLVRS